MKFRLKDPGSAITHFIGMIMALFAAVPLLIKASSYHNILYFVSMAIFIISMILLYAASTIYHSFDLSGDANRILRKLDHMMIFVLIAGTYTPVCVIALKGPVGYGLLAFIWIIALAGILVKALWITCPKWFSSALYISMGWACLLALPQLIHTLSRNAFLWLLLGGVVYTIGGVIYALKFSIFNTKHKHFGSHEIFHLFVMGGSGCHFIMMYFYL